ncbi:hypothetical protein D4764_21G0008380 [Takifugu flavidus]|uniref:Uncharacterized protein n=1 Tax=Takifugu flavidus TaxID=433684 RepID=A0A5C6NGG7_9TELE|nr:hypothetical protein D4764_21G0008380 [Takifugu flavidus]
MEFKVPKGLADPEEYLEIRVQRVHLGLKVIAARGEHLDLQEIKALASQVLRANEEYKDEWVLQDQWVKENLGHQGTEAMRDQRATAGLQEWAKKEKREIQELQVCQDRWDFQALASREKRGTKGLLDLLVREDLLDWG